MQQHSLESLDSQDMTERRPIPGYEGIYEIDALGNVYALKAFRRLKAGRMNKSTVSKKSGYMYINLSKDKKATKHYLHCLVMAAFNPTDDKTLEVNHIDGVKSNCALSNLEWLNHSQNIIHARDVLKVWADNRGEKSGNAKLTEDGVREIRKLWNNGKGMQQIEIAKMFSVSSVTISNICNRKAWNHID